MLMLAIVHLYLTPFVYDNNTRFSPNCFLLWLENRQKPNISVNKGFQIKNIMFWHFYPCLRFKEIRHFVLVLISARFLNKHIRKGNFINFTLRHYEILNCLKCGKVEQDDEIR